MENLEEGDEGGGFFRTEVFAVCVHIAATLDDLANELILSEEHGDLVEGGTAFASVAAESVAIMALLTLKNESALTLKCGAILQELLRNGIAAPGVHDGAPGSAACHVGESAQNDGEEEDGGFANDAAGHGPFVDAELENHQEMDTDESNEHAGNDEHVERVMMRTKSARQWIDAAGSDAGLKISGTGEACMTAKQQGTAPPCGLNRPAG